jgi:hypothetical protein
MVAQAEISQFPIQLRSGHARGKKNKDSRLCHDLVLHSNNRILVAAKEGIILRQSREMIDCEARFFHASLFAWSLSFVSISGVSCAAAVGSSAVIVAPIEPVSGARDRIDSVMKMNS